MKNHYANADLRRFRTSRLSQVCSSKRDAAFTYSPPTELVMYDHSKTLSNVYGKCYSHRHRSIGGLYTTTPDKWPSTHSRGHWLRGGPHLLGGPSEDVPHTPAVPQPLVQDGDDAHEQCVTDSLRPVLLFCRQVEKKQQKGRLSGHHHQHNQHTRSLRFSQYISPQLSSLLLIIWGDCFVY